MSCRPHWLPLLAAAACLGSFARPAPAQPMPDVEAQQEQVIKAAVKHVSPCVVQIETVGGTEVIAVGPQAQMRKGTGPTTGLIVASDGFIITSAFNFANKPQKIFVVVPGQKEKYVAEVFATDHSRMLTLLKIPATGLPVPEPAPKKGVVVGQTALALGRTLDPNGEHPPSVSMGIISAVDRIWGKAFQTDAKVSPANYGGPLVDLQGRVLGVLVPMSPQSDEETAGVEWYDGGIGFAVPLEDVNAVLPRLRAKQGTELRRGMLGITPKSGDIYSAAPVIGTVAPGSAAEKAGIKPDDTITAIDGRPVNRQAQVMHLLGPKYEGDSVKVTVKHKDGKEETYPNVTLHANVTVLARASLGILPLRDDPELGVAVRYVYPDGPAAKAGIKAGDRIIGVGPPNGPAMPIFTGQVSGREQLLELIGTQHAGQQLKFKVKRKDGGKEEELTVTLGELPATVAMTLPPESSAKKALEPLKHPGNAPMAKKEKDDEKKEKAEVGFFKRTNAAGDREYWVYVPDEDYDPNISHALLIWLHPPGKGKERDLKDIKSFWEGYCDKNHMILVCPVAENETGWVPSEVQFLGDTAREVMQHYTIDPRRVVMHGWGQGGEMAFYTAFHLRDLIRGVGVIGATLNSQAKDAEAPYPLSFYLVVGDKDPLLASVKESKSKLEGHKYPVVFREIPNLGHQYLSDDLAADAVDEMVRWIDSLDRI